MRKEQFPKLLLALVVLTYIAGTEIRIRNLQAESSLVYDASPCFAQSDNMDKLRKCFDVRGYIVNDAGPGLAYVPARTLCNYWSITSFGVEIAFDRDGRIKHWYFNASTGAF